MGIHCGRIMIPLREVHERIPQNLWICYLTWKRDFADGIKLRSLKQEDYPHYSSGPNVITRALNKKEASRPKSLMMLEVRIWTDVRKGLWVKECRQPLEVEKTTQWILPWSLMKECSPNDILNLDIPPSELQENNMHIVLSHWVVRTCFSSNRTQAV